MYEYFGVVIAYFHAAGNPPPTSLDDCEFSRNDDKMCTFSNKHPLLSIIQLRFQSSLRRKERPTIKIRHELFRRRSSAPRQIATHLIAKQFVLGSHVVWRQQMRSCGFARLCQPRVDNSEARALSEAQTNVALRDSVRCHLLNQAERQMAAEVLFMQSNSTYSYTMDHYPASVPHFLVFVQKHNCDCRERSGTPTRATRKPTVR